MNLQLITVKGYLESRDGGLTYPTSNMNTVHPTMSANLQVYKENWPYANEWDSEMLWIPVVIDTGWLNGSWFDYNYEITCFTDGNILYYGGTENGQNCSCKPLHHHFSC